MRILATLFLFVCSCFQIAQAAPLIITDLIPVSGYGSWEWDYMDFAGGIWFNFSGTSGGNSVSLHVDYGANNFPTTNPSHAYTLYGAPSEMGGYVGGASINDIHGSTVAITFNGDGTGLLSIYSAEEELLASAAISGYLYTTYLREVVYGSEFFTRTVYGTVEIAPNRPTPPVPEPSTLALIAIAGLPLWWSRKRRAT